MKQFIPRTIFVALFALGATVIYAGASMDMAGEMRQEPLDPKKKKVGEECAASDECQRHHFCKIPKDAAKGVCTAPPRATIPPGAVT